jgi:hypothetical protein
MSDRSKNRKMKIVENYGFVENYVDGFSGKIDFLVRFSFKIV